MRRIIVVVFVVNLIILGVSVSGLPITIVVALSPLLIHSVVMAVAAIVLSIWVWRDGVEIRYLTRNLNTILRQLEENRAEE